MPNIEQVRKIRKSAEIRSDGEYDGRFMCLVLNK